MEEDIRKQGTLFLQQQRFGKKWKRVWCVLYRDSACSISRLEFFECKDGGNAEKNDKTLRKQQESKKVIRLADCIRVQEAELDGAPRDSGGFLLETTDKMFVFAADRNQLDDWIRRLCEVAFPMSWTEGGAKRGSLQRGQRVEEDEGMEDNSLYSGREKVRDFKVSVRRTEASDRCRLKGDGVLRADMDALHLMDKAGDVLYTWPYRYLRRFGRDKATFSFEAGRRCDSGEGSFEFDTKQGNLLFQAVEAAIHLQKISLPHRQISAGGQETNQHSLGHSQGHSQGHSLGHSLGHSQGHSLGHSQGHSLGHSLGHSQGHSLGHSRTAPQPRVQVQQGGGGVYSLVTEPQHLQKIHSRDAESCSSAPQQLARLEPPVDKLLTGVKSLTLDPPGLPVPRKSQVKMMSSCPLPNASAEPGGGPPPGPAPRLSPQPPGPAPGPQLGPPSLEQPYSQISLAAARGSREAGGAAGGGRDPDYSLPFDSLAAGIMADMLGAEQGGPGADPLYDSIDELKVRNVFRSDAAAGGGGKVDHIYDEPEGCAAPPPPAAPPSVYDDPEEMRGDAWRIMGTAADPKGHEFPYDPRMDDYAVPRRPQRALASQRSIAGEEEEEQEEEEQEEEEPQEEEEQGGEEEELEEKRFSPYDNLVVKMA